MRLEPEVIRRLAAKTDITENTIRRWARGGKCYASTRRILSEALEQIKGNDREPEEAHP